MKGQLRKSGIDIIGDVPWGTHFCQFYQTKEDLIDILVPYFKAGLENNEVCIWIISQPVDVEEAKETLKKAVPDLDVYLEKGQIEIIPYTHIYSKDGAFDSERVLYGCIGKINHALASGYDGLRSSGDISWLKQVDWNNFIDYEEKVDSIIGNNQMITLCTYPLDKCNATEIIEVVVNHQFSLIKREGKWEQIESSRRKKAEEAAIQATKNWEHTFDAVPDLISILDTEYRIVRANKAMATRLGLTPEDCVGLTCYRVIHGTDDPPFFCPHRQMLKDGLEHTKEVCEDTLDGDFIVSVSPLHDSEGKLTGCIHVARDITERKRAEKALCEGEERLRFALETSHTGAWDLDLVDHTAHRSLEHDRIFGYEQLLPQWTYEMFLDHVLPEDRAMVDAKFRKATTERSDWSFECRIRRVDGAVRWIWAAGRHRVDAIGNLRRIAGIVQDITESKQAEEALRESEEKYRDLVETANEGILVIDAKLRTTYVNEKMAEMLGYSREELIVKSVRDFTDEQGKAVFEMNMKKRQQGINESHEFKFINKNGLPLWTLVNSKSLFDKDGKFIGSMSMLTDITKRKETEAKLKETLNNLESLVKERTSELEEAYKSLKESEKGLAKAQEMAHLGNWDWNIETDGLYWSDEIYRIFERSPQDFGATYDAFLSYVHPDDRDYVNNAVIQALNGKPCSIDHRIVLTNGEERVVHEQGEVIFDNKNNPVRMRGTVQDITERRKTEKALELSEERYRIVTEQTGQLVYDYNVEKDTTDWAGNIKELTGFPPNQFKSMSLKFWLSRIHPEDLDRYLENYNKYMKSGNAYRTEYRFRKKNEEYIYIEDNGVCLKDEKGKVNRILGVIKDITERKLSQEKMEISERKYRSFVENFKGIVYQADENFIPQFLHGAVEEITGYSEEEFLFELPWKDIIEPEYLPIILNEGIKTRAVPDACTIEREFRIKNRKGKTKWVHETCQKIPGENGKPTYQGVIYDITERKQAEINLANIETARKKEIHHRIKNNLQVISSLLDLQAEKFRSREYAEDSEVLNAFRESQDRVTSIALIHEELHEGRGTDTLNFSPYLERLVKNLFQTYRLGNANTSLNIELEKNIFFDMDIAVPLGIIINELVSNSFKYAFSDKNKGLIQIKLCREKPAEYTDNSPYTDNSSGRKKEGYNDTSFILTVTDNGIGIPEDFNSENSGSLGLQLVAILVDQLGGELELKRNNGTEFTMRFKVTDKKC